jgi:hypothetical protein
MRVDQLAGPQWTDRLLATPAGGPAVDQEWATIIATIVVLATSIGAAIFTYIGMSNPTHLPDSLAVVTSLLALLVPLGITYFSRLFANGR